MTLTRARTVQYIGILFSLGLIAVGYWYWSVRAGVKTNTGGLQPQGVGNLSAGLAGYWKLDETTGSSATDASTNGNTGTLTNMENGDWVTGQIGNGLTFDGTNEYVIASSVPVYDVGTNPFSLSVWFKTTDTSGAIVAKGGTNSGGKRYYIGTETADCSSGKLKVDIDDDTTKQFVCSTTTVTDDAWHHVMLVRTRTALTLFLDGKAEGTSVDLTGYGSLNSPRDFYIGGAYDESSGPVGDFSGSIDEVRLYNRAFSSDEVGNLYRLTTPTGVDTSLKGYWSFNGDALLGTTAYDWSGAGNTGTLTNSPAIVEGLIGQALSFDGTDDYLSAPDSTALDLPIAHSVSVWIKPNAITDGLILSKGTCGGSYASYALKIGTNDGGGTAGKINYTVRLSDNAGNRVDVTQVGSPVIGAWTHVVGTHDGTTLRLYINGTLDSTAAGNASAPYNNNNILQMGSDFDCVSGRRYQFNGAIDEPRLYARTLSADEIKGLYDLAKPDATNSASSQAQGTGRLDSGLAFYLQLDEGTGTNANDTSTNGETLVLTNGPTWTTGQIGGAVNFDGSNDTLSSSTFDVTIPAGTKVTTSFWYNATVSNGSTATVFQRAGGGCDQYITSILGGVSTDTLTFYYRDTSCTGIDNYQVSGISKTGWHHVVSTYDTTTGIFIAYVDGTQRATTTSSVPGGTIAAGVYMTIGGNQGGGGFLSGIIDEFRIYKRVLSADEVGELYRLTTPTSVDTSLKGYWSFNGQDVSGTTAYDRSGLGSTGTLTNSPTIINGIIGQGLSFDGTDDYVNLGASTPYQFANTTFTVTGWFKSSPSVNGGAFMAQGGIAGQGGWFVGLNGDTGGKLTAVLKNTDGGQTGRLSTKTGFNDNNWHQFAFVVTTNTSTYTGNGLVIYADGVLQPSTANSDSTSGGYGTSGLAALLGSRGSGSDAFFNGGLDEVRIYNRALTAAEIQSQYDAVKPDKTNSSVTQPQGTGRLDSGLAGYWKLDENTGTTANDSSTNGNTGTFVNSPSWTTGRIGSGLTSFSTTAYVNVPHNATLNSLPFSLSFWVKTNDATSSRRIVIGKDYVDGYRCQVSAGAMRCWFIAAGGGSWYDGGDGYSFGNVADDQWHLITMVISASGGVGYLDGVQTVSQPWAGGSPAAPTGTGALLLGTGSGGSPINDFTGSLDEVRIYNRDLSADEVSQLYRLGTPTGTDTSLKGYWSFNGQDMSGATAYDRSGAGINGTLNGNTTISEGKLGQALSFDGTGDFVNLGNTLELGLPMSVSAWINLSAYPVSVGGILTTDKTNPGDHYHSGMWFQVRSNGVLGVNYGDNTNCLSGARRSYAGTKILALNTWHHVTAIVSGPTDMKLYIDGVEDIGTYEGEGGAIAYMNYSAAIGRVTDCPSGSGLDFPGKIDEVRIYNRVLSPTEVQTSYKQNK